MFSGPILALDLATSTGWAYGSPGTKHLEFGSLRFGKPGADRAGKYRTFRTWLSMHLSTHPAELVVFESAASATAMSGRTTMDIIKWLVGMCEHLEEFCYERVELREGKTSDVRNYFIGNNPKREIAKAKTIEKCRSFGWNVANDDEADACALWCYQVGQLRPDLAASMTPLFYGKRRIVG
ncbi:MAG: hypothetical protein V4773_16600 [Verrucomicrobiota bacterium]